MILAGLAGGCVTADATAGRDVCLTCSKRTTSWLSHHPND